MESLFDRIHDRIQPGDWNRPRITDREMHVAYRSQSMPDGRFAEGDDGFDLVGIGRSQRFGVIRAAEIQAFGYLS